MENNKRFDKEYSTQYVLEVLALKNEGIRYEFVKKIDGISTYKYKKTSKLFEVLSELYKNM